MKSGLASGLEMAYEFNWIINGGCKYWWPKQAISLRVLSRQTRQDYKDPLITLPGCYPGLRHCLHGLDGHLSVNRCAYCTTAGRTTDDLFRFFNPFIKVRQTEFISTLQKWKKKKRHYSRWPWTGILKS